MFRIAAMETGETTNTKRAINISLKQGLGCDLKILNPNNTLKQY